MPTIWLRLQRGVGIVLLLMLAGCFRPAGDSVQPTVQSDASSGEVSTSNGAADLPPITLIAPPTAQSDGSNGAEPAMTLVTLAPATSTPVPSTAPNVPTITLQVITPGMVGDGRTPAGGGVEHDAGLD